MDDLTQLGRYQLVRVLGRGAMGVVYEGLDPKLNRQVAIKVIRKNKDEDANLRAEYSARFIREAQAVARLSHSNIVHVFDFGEENDVMYIVMEYIQGEELKHAFDRKQQFSLPDIVRMCSELLDAIDYAHSKKIIHRDIKPANVMLDYQGHVKLTDFGVARLTDTNYERTVVGMLIGTPSYMSPEQISGGTISPRSDIFAVGVILYQFLTGRKPFQAGGAYATQQKILQEDPELPSSINTNLGNAYDCVAFRALAKNSEDRYESALAFKQDLQRALAGEELQEGNTLPFRSILPEQSNPPVEAQTVSMGLNADDTHPAGKAPNPTDDDDDEITQVRPRDEMLQTISESVVATTAVPNPAPINPAPINPTPINPAAINTPQAQSPNTVATSGRAPLVVGKPPATETKPPAARSNSEKPQAKTSPAPSSPKAALVISATVGVCVIGIVATYFALQPANETVVHQSAASKPAASVSQNTTPSPTPEATPTPTPTPTPSPTPAPVDTAMLEAEEDVARETYLLPKKAKWLVQARIEEGKQSDLARKKLLAEEAASKQRMTLEAEEKRRAEQEIARKAEAEAAEIKRKQDEINRKKAEEQRLKEEKELKRKKDLEEREAEYRRRLETR